MKPLVFAIFFLLALLHSSWEGYNSPWRTEKQEGYTIHYTTSDTQNLAEYKAFFKTGKEAVEVFFDSAFKKEFDIYIHPSRTSLDSTWQKNWNLPDFKSQCWMVASGVYDRVDIISPKLWDSLACEHRYANSMKTQRLITHELVHVYHGQHNVSPDFSNVTGIDWFVEGLAVYASGQCDSTRISEVKKALKEQKIPKKLEQFWSGNLKYGQSGTVVMFIDKTFGREKLISLLQYNSISDLTSQLNTTSEDLVNHWKTYIAAL